MVHLNLEQLRLKLAQSFVDHHRGSVGEVQGADGTRTGNHDKLLRICLMERLRQAHRFAPKHDHIATLKGMLRVGFAVPSAGEDKAMTLQSRPHRLKVFVNPEVHESPIVQSSPSHCFFVDGKPQGLHQMQPTSRPNAQTSNGAGVLGYFGGDQHDVQKRSMFRIGSRLRVRARRAQGFLTTPASIFRCRRQRAPGG